MTEPDEDGTLGQVRSYLNRSGLPLELRVAKAFRPKLMGIFTTGNVQQRLTYDTRNAEGLAIVRETDVVVTSYQFVGETGQNIHFRLVIECKSGKDASWIFYRDRQRWELQDGENAFDTFWFTDAMTTSALDLASVPILDGSWLLSGRPGGWHPMGLGWSSFSADNTKTKDGKNTTRDALLQVLSASDELSKIPPPPNTRVVTIPIIVTSAPMFSVSESDDSPTTSPDSFGIQETTRELVTGQFKANDKRRAVWVFHESEIEILADTFIQEIRNYELHKLGS